MLAVFGQMIAKPGNHPLWNIATVNGRGHGSSGYNDGGAFGRCHFGARRSIRRAKRIAQGKYTLR